MASPKVRVSVQDGYTGRTLDDIRKADCTVLEYTGRDKNRSFRGITYDRKTGHIIATDINNKEVCIFDLQERGVLLNSFRLNDPGTATNGIAVLPSGLILVSDYYKKNIKSYTTEGQYVGAFTENLSGPNGIAAGPNGLVYVAESSLKQIHVFDPKGAKAFKMGNLVKDDESRQLPDGKRFLWPSKVFASIDGSVYVSDVQANNVTVFDSDGHYLRKIGCSNKLKSPSGVTESAEGYIVISSLSQGDNKVAFYTVNNCFRHSFSPVGPGGDCRGITADENGFLYATDIIDSRIVKF